MLEVRNAAFVCSFLTIQGSHGIPTSCEIMSCVGKHVHPLLHHRIEPALMTLSFECVYAGSLGPLVVNLIKYNSFKGVNFGY